TLRFALVAIILFILVAVQAAKDEGPSIRLNTDAAKTIDVAGLSLKDLESIKKLALKDDDWQPLFAVYVVPAVGKERGPALLGSYRVENGLLRFEPRFPLVRGVRYQALFDPARVPTRAALKEQAIEKEI